MVKKGAPEILHLSATIKCKNFFFAFIWQHFGVDSFLPKVFCLDKVLWLLFVIDTLQSPEVSKWLENPLQKKTFLLLSHIKFYVQNLIKFRVHFKKVFAVDQLTLQGRRHCEQIYDWRLHCKSLKANLGQSLGLGHLC